MRKSASVATIFVLGATFSLAGSWTGKLVDALCKASSEASKARCAASPATHLFAIELPDARILNLDASGNEKASNAIKTVRNADPRATVTGSLDGGTVKVEKIEIQ